MCCVERETLFPGMGGRPRTYVQVGGRDVLRDDEVVFAGVLEEVGTEVRLDGFDGFAHESWTVFFGGRKRMRKGWRGG